MLRITGGSAKGQRLQTPKGSLIRPTLGRVRQAIFSTLQAMNHKDPLAGLALDLFAGTGALGIEALSRGVDFCTFVDDAKESIRLIRMNLERTGLTDRARIHQQKIPRALKTLKDSASLILCDPPYGPKQMLSALKMIEKEKTLAENGVLVAQVGKFVILPEQYGSLRLFKVRTYGETAIYFYEVTHE